MLPTRKNNLIPSISKNSGKSNVKYFFSLRSVLLPISSLSVSQYLSAFTQAPIFHPLCAYFCIVSAQTQLLLLCYWLPSLPWLFTPVASYPKTPAPLYCLWSLSDRLWRPQGCTSLLILQVQPLPPLPPTTTAQPQGQRIPHSRASQWRCIPVFASHHLFENVTISQSPSKAIRPPW